MDTNMNAVIVGSGSYIPTLRVSNDDFLNHVFYDQDGKVLSKKNKDIIQQFAKITGIQERRYVSDDQVSSDIMSLAAADALKSSGIDGESLDYIIVAHNFGDVKATNSHSDFVPTLACRVKHQLGIINPLTVAYDLTWGCAGWLQGVIQANFFIKSGNAKRVMVIGGETLSRVCDPHDRDSMIFSDGAGAVILEAQHSIHPVGILSHVSKSYTDGLAYVLRMGASYNPDFDSNALFIKMNGRKLYENVLKTVPSTIKDCLDKAALTISDVDKVLIHQANEKMDEAILRELFNIYGGEEHKPLVDLMPMTISWLGNSSVATLPTLFDLILKGKFENQQFTPGTNIVFTAVGAGVNMNAVVYRIP
ncbi:3-oxoacyl-ACP synthase III family protein [Chitinophaga sancti]|uniref:3-oxoacyl-[acyl-carrier-protein] synthase-3 n=1 Tax=Chitinophaga sancti TaxID=1004 RepID=A0A1K1RXE1_9BACT|nr:ketoacyl-ACP synthase III [Chitinophaga sancti]WQD64007.1 ketoacyl-ACP synthase III [Chitinophaga sancti]WQG90369.1 ketoacyl-ACP synthase III [Chitinophaga sancti]SFW76455.1 3-oxoacyl-[acyl-carrier-protein] synthase-3 [Chitinophaga sancti]